MVDHPRELRAKIILKFRRATLLNMLVFRRNVKM